MKKFLVIFALFCALFLISCGSDEEDASGQQSGTSDTVTDNESESPDSSSQDAEVTETEETASEDDTDTAEPERKRGELYGEGYPNKTCNEGLVCDTENNICIKVIQATTKLLAKTKTTTKIPVIHSLTKTAAQEKVTKKNALQPAEPTD